jgi:hypothetical protein
MTLGITFHGLPNEAVIGFEFIFSMLFGMLLIRGAYIWMHRPHQYPNDQVHLAALGARWLKFLTIPMMTVLLILSARIDPGIPAGKFWELDSISRGWWCVIRIMIGAMATLCASVFETHPLFRAWASMTVPLISICDLLSQANFAVQISCIEHGLCQSDDELRSDLYNLAWRDIVSAVLTLAFTGVSTWCWFLYGIWRNDLHMPRMELRGMSARLDKIRMKPREIRRRTEDENQLEKMLGYN